MLFKIAARSILRNRRRSLVTALAITVGATALIVFGAFQAYVYLQLETAAVRSVGHLSVFRDGYFLYGSGNPAAWGIDEHQRVMQLIAEDPVLKPMLRVITPRLVLQGIAGHHENGVDAAKTFMGVGIVASDRDRMLGWDDLHAGPVPPDKVALHDDAPDQGRLGVGIARILGVCGPPALPDCAAPPPTPGSEGGAPIPADIANLAREAAPAAPLQGGPPRIDLLAATSGGAPNVVSLEVVGTDAQPAKELDDVYIEMNLKLAQQLLYGRDTPKVTALVLQLVHSADMGAARARLQTLFHDNGLKLEVRDFTELTPFYGQVRNFFGALFLFVTTIIGVIVLFTVVNTMTMAVVERTPEIGTIRALGARRGAIRRQFLLEGAMLGAIGATSGVVVSRLLIALINHSGARWTPPGNAAPVPFHMADTGIGGLLLMTWIGLVLIATIAALIPANRAARLRVVDALRHV